MLEMFNILDDITENTTMCGGIAVPDSLFNLVATIIRIIKIVVPILLIIWGMLDFAKSVVAKKEEDIKKYQKAFISRLISAVLVFLVITIVQLLVNLLAGVEQESGEGEQTADIWDCSKKFINGVETDNDTTTDEENTEESTQTE